MPYIMEYAEAVVLSVFNIGDACVISSLPISVHILSIYKISVLVCLQGIYGSITIPICNHCHRET